MRLLLPLLLSLIFLDTVVKATDEGCKVIQYDEYCRVQKGLLTNEKDLIIQVDDPLGEKYTEQSIPFTKKNGIRDFRVTIEDLNGNVIRKIKKSEYTDHSSNSAGLYNDHLIRTFHLKYNLYPYRIHIHYKQISGEFKFIDEFVPVIDESVPTLSASLVVDVPESYPILFRQQHADSPKVSNDAGIHHLHWNIKYSPADYDEIYAPPAETVLPEVTVLPEIFFYGIEGSLKDWASFGSWFYNLNKNRDQLTIQDKRKVQDIINNCTDVREKIRRLYHYLQDNTRYVNVTIDIGGWQTYPAQYVCENKFGDCKALTNYMKALLKEAGIPSYFALVYADDQIISPEIDFACPKFNHVILCVPVKSDTVWLECTSNYNPTDYLGTFTQNRWALFIDSVNSHLVKTPVLSVSQVTNQTSEHISIDEQGNAKIELNLTARGEKYDYLERFSQYRTDQEKNIVIQKFIRSAMNFPNFDLISWKITRPDRDSAFVNLYVQLSVNKFTENYNSENILPLGHQVLSDLETPAKRDLPLYISYPDARTDSLLISYPADWEPDISFENTAYDSPYIKYRTDWNIKGRTILFTRNMSISAGTYPLSEYPKFYNAIIEVNKLERKNVVVFKK